jgi:L-aspartate oxidase
VQAHGDQTGAEVARTLIEKVRESANVRVIETARVLDLIVQDDKCLGVRASVAGQATEIIADATVLATGGCGQVYRYTTNPDVATGDGFAIAHRAGRSSPTWSSCSSIPPRSTPRRTRSPS